MDGLVAKLIADDHVVTNYWDEVAHLPPMSASDLDARFDQETPRLQQQYPDEWVTIDATGNIIGHFKDRYDSMRFIESLKPDAKIRTRFIRVESPLEHLG
jgi:hypothetical protein